MYIEDAVQTTRICNYFTFFFSIYHSILSVKFFFHQKHYLKRDLTSRFSFAINLTIDSGFQYTHNTAKILFNVKKINEIICFEDLKCQRICFSFTI